MEEMWVEQVRQPRVHENHDLENRLHLQQLQILISRDPLGKHLVSKVTECFTWDDIARGCRMQTLSSKKKNNTHGATGVLGSTLQTNSG